VILKWGLDTKQHQERGPEQAALTGTLEPGIEGVGAGPITPTGPAGPGVETDQTAWAACKSWCASLCCMGGEGL
jgi:hypothetical protein